MRICTTDHDTVLFFSHFLVTRLYSSFESTLSRAVEAKTKIKELLTTSQAGAWACVSGWVKTKRAGKEIIFITMNDGSTLHNLQVVANAEQVSENTLQSITPGSSLCVGGRLMASPGKKQHIELHADKITVLGEAIDYPLQPKKHSLAFLREMAHLRFRTNTFGAVFRIRHAISHAIHQFFYERNFVYLHTPIITSIDTEGAGKRFQVTTLNTHHLSKKESGDLEQDFFREETHLTVSGQLEAEAAALGLAEVYTFGPCFRAENSQTTRHLAEFWMVEPEMAFYNLEDSITLAETLLKHLIRFVLTHCLDDLTLLQRRALEESSTEKKMPTALPLLERLERVVQKPFARITYTDAITILKASEPNQKGEFAYPIQDWGRDLQSEHERYLTEQYFKQPVVVTDYPSTIKAFYMRQNDDNKTVAAMDILLPGVGEVVGGSQREERLEQLVTRIKQMQLDEKSLQWYIDTRRFGTAPHSGFGMGLERFVQFVTGMGNIRDVIPFPRTPGNAAF